MDKGCKVVALRVETDNARHGQYSSLWL